MSMTGIANEQLTAYTIMLIQNGLLNYDSRTHQFFATAKGLSFLKLYYRMKQSVNIDEFEGLLKKDGKKISLTKRTEKHWAFEPKIQNNNYQPSDQGIDNFKTYLTN
jgi:hypothetical protein